MSKLMMMLDYLKRGNSSILCCCITLALFQFLLAFFSDDAFAGIEVGEPIDNTFYGISAGDSITNGTFNSLFGYFAGGRLTEGQYNTFIGMNVGVYTDTGSSNTFLGAGTGFLNRTGSKNTLVGANAGNHIVGDSNVFLGYQAGFDEQGTNKLVIDNCFTGGDTCTAPFIYGEFDNRVLKIDGSLGIGKFPSTALDINGIVTATAFVGDGTGLSGVLVAESDPKIGSLVSNGWCTSDGSVVNCTSSAPGVNGNDNTSIGVKAGTSSLHPGNSFFGTYAGNSNTDGFNNSFMGAYSGVSNTSGRENSFFGYGAGNWNITGDFNTFIGNGTGQSNQYGAFNSYFGYKAGLYGHSGSNNTFVGAYAGFHNVDYDSNIFIGYMAGYYAEGSNKLYIDNCYTGYTSSTGGSCTQPLIYGEFDTRLIKIDGSLSIVSVATPSDIRYKKDIHPIEQSLEKVLMLQGVTYTWDQDKVNGTGYAKDRQIGLIAQDVEKVLPELVHTDSEGYKTLSYDKVVPVLIEAIKEQQKEIREKDIEIQLLKKAMFGLSSRLEVLESSGRRVASN